MHKRYMYNYVFIFVILMFFGMSGRGNDNNLQIEYQQEGTSEFSVSNNKLFQIGGGDSKAQTTSRSQRHPLRRKHKYSKPESNSEKPESHSRSRAESNSDMSSVSNAPKMPLQSSLRETYLYRGVWELGVSIGAVHAITDLANNKNLAPGDFISYHTQNYDMSFGFFGRYAMNSWFAINLGLEYASLSADNNLGITSEIPAVRFENDIFEFYGRTEFMLPALARSPWDVYVFAGIGILFTDARLYREDNIFITLDDDYSQVQPFLPLGAGFNYLIAQKLKLGYEFGWRNTVFHYLDGVKIPASAYDKYFMNSFKLSYRF
jgi:hypothetical protein